MSKQPAKKNTASDKVVNMAEAKVKVIETKKAEAAKLAAELEQHRGTINMLAGLIKAGQDKLITKQEQILTISDRVKARRVPGGWLYQTCILNESRNIVDTHVTFVPYGPAEETAVRDDIKEMVEDLTKETKELKQKNSKFNKLAIELEKLEGKKK